MTLRQETGPIPSANGGDGQPRPEAITQDAREGAANVVSTTTENVREVAEEVGQQAKAVASEAKRQLDQVVSQGRDELRQQMDQRNAQLAEQLRTLSGQFRALTQGNTSEAGPLLGYLNDAQTQVQRLAMRLETSGPQGVVDDISRFARRRPGLFLLSAMGAGFLAGRMVRAGTAVRQESANDEAASVTAPTGAPTASLRPAGSSLPSADDSPSAPEFTGATP
jgi:hypothetical protein